MQAMNEKEMQELAKEHSEKGLFPMKAFLILVLILDASCKPKLSIEREIDLAKQEIEKQKLELLKAEELKRRNQEYDLIAKQIVKLSSRKKTQK